MGHTWQLGASWPWSCCTRPYQHRWPASHTLISAALWTRRACPDLAVDKPHKTLLAAQVWSPDGRSALSSCKVLLQGRVIAPPVAGPHGGAVPSVWRPPTSACLAATVAGFAPADGLTVALTVSLTARW